MSVDFSTAPVSARIPATSANLGPGFDALGLALSMFDELTARVTNSGLYVEIAGEGAQLPTDESHLVVRAMRAAFARLGGQPPGLALRCVNRIPHGRGLGSSAAAIVAGLVLARALVVEGPARLHDDELLALATELEGHPDNVAACLYGGLTIAWSDATGVRAVRLDVDRSVSPVALVPPFEASTELARGLLPASVPHADAAFAAGRSALLVAALTGRPDLLLPATDDRLHQGYRSPAMPDSATLVAELRRAGLAAVVSGAGPTVLVLRSNDSEADAVQALVPQGWEVHWLPISSSGAVVGTGETPPALP